MIVVIKNKLLDSESVDPQYFFDMTEYQKIVIGKKFKNIQISSENIYNLILRSPVIQNKTPR